MPWGFTVRRTGLSLTAVRRASQRSGLSSDDSAELAASRKRTANSAEKRAAGSGGRAESFNALVTWPSSKWRATSSDQDWRLASTRCSSISRMETTRSRDASSRATSEPLTRALRSLVASAEPDATAASARSRHSAAFTFVTRASAMAMTPSVLGSGRPSSRARSRSKNSAVRTAGMPPRSNCCAIGRCSGGRLSSIALRWVLAGLSRRWRC